MQFSCGDALIEVVHRPREDIRYGALAGGLPTPTALMIACWRADEMSPTSKMVQNPAHGCSQFVTTPATCPRLSCNTSKALMIG
jgi:hypothetical protein